MAVQASPDIKPIYNRTSGVDILHGTKALIALRVVMGEVLESEIEDSELPVHHTEALLRSIWLPNRKSFMK